MSSDDLKHSDSSSLSSYALRVKSRYGLSTILKQLKADLESNFDSISKDIKEVSQRVTTLENREQSSPTNTVTLRSALVQSDPHPCNDQNNTNLTDVVQSDCPLTAKDKETSNTVPCDEHNDLLDYNETMFWQPEVEDDQPTELRKILDATATLLRSSLSRPVPNEKRRALKRKIPPLESPFTKCPKLDLAIMECLPKTAKDQNRSLAKTQTWVLDAIPPLVEILESARAGTLNSKAAADAAQQSLTFIGNTAASISVERRRKAAQHITETWPVW